MHLLTTRVRQLAAICFARLLQWRERALQHLRGRTADAGRGEWVSISGACSWAATSLQSRLIPVANLAPARVRPPTAASGHTTSGAAACGRPDTMFVGAGVGVDRCGAQGWGLILTSLGQSHGQSRPISWPCSRTGSRWGSGYRTPIRIASPAGRRAARDPCPRPAYAPSHPPGMNIVSSLAEFQSFDVSGAHVPAARVGDAGLAPDAAGAIEVEEVAGGKTAILLALDVRVQTYFLGAAGGE